MAYLCFIDSYFMAQVRYAGKPWLHACVIEQVYILRPFEVILGSC